MGLWRFFVEDFPNLEIVPVNVEIAKVGANLRNKYYPRIKFSYADAINLATAITKKCKVFYTGDEDFKEVKEMQIKII